MTQDERDGVIEEAMDVCAEVRDGEPPQSWPKDYAEGFKAGADNCVSMIFNTLSHGRGRKSPTPQHGDGEDAELRDLLVQIFAAFHFSGMAKRIKASGLTEDEMDELRIRGLTIALRRSRPSPAITSYDDLGDLEKHARVGDEAGVLPKLAAAHQAIDQGGIADAKRFIAEASETVAAMKRLAAVDDEMVERVARKLCPIDPDSDTEYTGHGRWYREGTPHWHSWIGDARAVLQAALSPLPKPPQPSIGKGEG